jgi:LEA14-like dessication related protein
MNISSSHMRIIAGLLAAMVLCLAGCATLSGLKTPEIKLAGLRAAEIKGLEAVFEVDLRVINPNKTPLDIQGVDCELAFNGRHLARGVAGPQTEIPAYGSGVASVTIYASLLDLFGAARRMVESANSDAPNERWTYAVKGSLDLGSTWFASIPFASGGEIDPRELMATQPSKKSEIKQE